MTIAFLDHHLDNWHAKTFLGLLRERGHEVVAFETNALEGDWCAANDVRRASSLDEAVDASEAVMLLAPDDIDAHLDLALAAIPSGKPLWIDKQVAPTVEETLRILRMAEYHSTSVTSGSSLRHAVELEAALRDGSPWSEERAEGGTVGEGVLDREERAEGWLRAPAWKTVGDGVSQEAKGRLRAPAWKTQIEETTSDPKLECENDPALAPPPPALEEAFFTGYGAWDRYGVHTVAMALRTMGGGVKRLINVGTASMPVVTLEWPDGRRATLVVAEGPQASAAFPWRFALRYEEGYVHATVTDFAGFYHRQLDAVLKDFASRTSHASDEMLDTVKILQAVPFASTWTDL